MKIEKKIHWYPRYIMIAPFIETKELYDNIHKWVKDHTGDTVTGPAEIYQKTIDDKNKEYQITFWKMK